MGPAADTVRHGCILESGEASRKMPVSNVSVKAVADLFSVESLPTNAVIATLIFSYVVSDFTGTATGVGSQEPEL